MSTKQPVFDCVRHLRNAIDRLWLQDARYRRMRQEHERREAIRAEYPDIFARSEQPSASDGENAVEVSK